MDPATEQLVRDYLNRVAVAARTSMSPDEVRTFLARLRDSIERQCGAYGAADLAEVSDVLATLGEPKSLAELERARLSAVRAGLDGAVSPYTAGPQGAAGPQAAGGRRGSSRKARGMVPGPLDAGGKPAGDFGGRQPWFPVKPWRTTRHRDDQLAGAAGPAAGAAGTGSPAGAAEPGRAASSQAIQRRPVTARWRPGEVLTDKAGRRKALPRPRGPQGRDSPVLLPVKQGRTSWQGRRAGTGSTAAAEPAAAEPAAAVGSAAAEQTAAEPAAAEQRGESLAFVVEPTPGPRRTPAALPKFRPVRWPDAASRPSQGRVPAPPQARSPEPVPAAAGSYLDREPGDEPEFGGPPEFGRDAEFGGPPGFGGDAAGGDEPAVGDEAAARPWRRPGPRPASGSGDGMPGAGPDRAERVASWLAALSAAAWAMARRHPLETIAVVVLGLGGLIYPPVWLAGALLAISSRLWDIRDKITGLAVPAVLTIVGAAGLAMVTSHASAGAYVRDALMIGGYLLRAGAVLGAAYLTWRVRVGQRQPPPPPWRRDYH